MASTNVPVFPRMTLSVLWIVITGRLELAEKALASLFSLAPSSAARLTGVRSGRATAAGRGRAVGAFRDDTLPGPPSSRRASLAGDRVGPPSSRGVAWTIGASAKATTNNTAVTLLF